VMPERYRETYWAEILTYPYFPLGCGLIGIFRCMNRDLFSTLARDEKI
jgi:hypothetical protein